MLKFLHQQPRDHLRHD